MAKQVDLHSRKRETDLYWLGDEEEHYDFVVKYETSDDRRFVFIEEFKDAIDFYYKHFNSSDSYEVKLYKVGHHYITKYYRGT